MISAAATQRVRAFPAHCPTSGAKNDGSVQGTAPTNENSLQLHAVPSERAWVEMTALQEKQGKDVRKPIGCLTCGWQRGHLASLTLCPCSRRSQYWSWRSRLRVVPASGPEHDVGLRCPPRRLLGKRGTGNEGLWQPEKQAYVCLIPSLQRRQRNRFSFC